MYEYIIINVIGSYSINFYNQILHLYSSLLPFAQHFGDFINRVFKGYFVSDHPQ